MRSTDHRSDSTGLWARLRAWLLPRRVAQRSRQSVLAVALSGTAGTLGGLAGCSTPPMAPPDGPQPGSAGVGPGSGALPANWAEYRYRAAERLLAMNPQGSYRGKPPEPMLAIPVLTIHLNADGSVARIVVMREPRQAKDTIELAKAAVLRAAPFGSVAHLPRPWQFNEVFLFDDDRRFMPSSLDQYQ